MTLFITPYGRFRQRMRPQERYQGEQQYMGESDLIVPVDVRAEGDDFIITAVVPGVQPEDIDVQVMNETVTIQGEIRDERTEADKYLLQERPTGRFFRSISMPTQLDPNKADANFENGILTLRIPKAETARARSIKIATK